MKGKAIQALSIASVISTAGLGVAHAEFIPTRPLGQAGGSDLQQRTGDAVQAVCGQFIQNGIDDAAPNAALQADLFDKCGEMVNTANALNGAEMGTARNLGISAEQLQGALQNVAGEEALASGSLSTEISADQSANVTKRIASLLSGTAGLQVSSANLFGSDGVFAFDQTQISGPMTGGAASLDPSNPSGLGAYVNGIVGEAARSGTESEDGFEATSTGITVGLDYNFNSQWVLGAAFGVTSHSADFIENENVAGGGLDMDSLALSLYGLWLGDDWYLDSIVSFGSGTVDLERRVVARAETDSTQLGFSVGAGMDIVNGPFTIAPYGRLSLLSVTIDAYDETGAQGLDLSVDEQDIESITSAFGFRLVAIKSTSFGVLAPQLSMELVHEFADNERELVTTYVNDPRQNELLVTTDAPDRDYLVAGMGISSVTRGGLQTFADVKSSIGLEGINDVVYTIGGRFEF